MNNAFRVPSRPQGGGMPEYRQQTTGPQAGANISARLEDRGQAALNQSVQAGLAQAGRNADMQAREWEHFNRGLQGFLRSGLSLYNDYRDKTSRALVSEAMMTAREQMEAWRTEYDKAHMGGDGLQAAQDYQKEWERLYGQHMQALREKGVSGPYEHMANMQFRESGLHYNAAGQRFQEQQDRAWNDSVLKGMEAQLVREAQNNPDDVAYQGLLLGQYMQQWQRLHPGLDGSAVQQGMAEKMTLARFGTVLEAGDVAGAQRLLAQFGSTLSAEQRTRLRNTIDSTILRQVDSLARAGDFEGARRVAAQGNAYGGVGSIAMRYESGGNVAAISPDTSGSKSYGKYQFNTLGKGTAHTFMQYVVKAHPELYAALGGGKLAVGSAEFDAAWKRASATMREEMGKAQDEHMAAAYLKPVREKLSGLGLPGAIEKSAAFQEMALSTAIQHGPGGAARILREAWGAVDRKADPQSQLRQFIETTYAYRGRPGEFRTAEAEKPGTLQAMRGRFAREMRDVLSMAGGSQADGKPPVYALSTPQATAELEAKMTGIAKMEHAQNVERMSAAVWEQTTGLSVERRRAAAVDMVGTMSDDPKTQGEVMALFDRNLKFQEIQEKAADGRAVNAFIEQAQKQQWTPSQILAELEKNAEMSDAAKAAAREHFFGKPKAGPQDDARSRAALATLYRAIDENPDLSDARIEAFAFESRLTTEQTKAALKYKADGGNIGGLSLSKVEGIYKRATGKKEMPEGLFEQVVAQIEPGKKPTERDLMQIVANTVMSGESIGSGWRGLWDKDESYGDALKAGRGDTWLPDIKDADERDALKNALPGNARVNDFNLRLLKKRNMGIKDTRPWSEEQ